MPTKFIFRHIDRHQFTIKPGVETIQTEGSNLKSHKLVDSLQTPWVKKKRSQWIFQVQT